MLIEDKVKSFIDRYKLKEPFLLAFSGGYDSMCLADVLIKLGYEIILIHLNHGWRGLESDNDEKNCKDFADARNIKFYSEKLAADIPQTETAARDARYAFFRNCAKNFKSNVVFTAHNYNDNAETVLYRIIRGTGTVGLQGISEFREMFYRPLLGVKREDIEIYCKDNNLSPNFDSSNENTKYKRNLIRKKLIPLMSEINPNVIDALNSLSEIAKSDKQDDNIELYYIRKLLIDNGLDYDRKKICEIMNFVKENHNSKSGKTYSLAKNLWLFVSSKSLKVITKTDKISECIKIKSLGEYEFGDYKFIIKKFDEHVYDCNKLPSDSEYLAFVSFNGIDFTLRCRKDGDFIQPLGMKGSQKLKKYLNEKKIPQYKKDDILLLCKDNEVLWVAGIGVSEKIKVVNKPTHVIELRGKNERFEKF